MTSSQTDLRALRRGPRTHDQPVAALPETNGPVVPRPKARWATRLLVPAAVLIATAGLLAYAARDALRPRLAVQVAAVIPKAGAAVVAGTDEAVAAAQGDGDAPGAALGPVVVQAPGWVEPAPFAVSVPALAEGVVQDVLVLEGERIEAGQVVARFIDDDATLAVRAAQAMVAERASDVERARSALSTAESQVQVERIAADELRDDVTRKRELVKVGGVSAGEFRQLEFRLSGQEARIATAEHVVGEARAALAQAQAAHATALVAADEAALRLARMEVRSPVAGVVLSRLVEPGSRMSMGSDVTTGGMSGVVLRVYDPAKLQVRVDVPLADAAHVAVGTRAVVTTEALADQDFTGVVTRVVHEANIQRNTVQFKIAIDSPSPVLKPEMLMRVKLHAPARGPGRTGGESVGNDSDMMLLVPKSAVTSIGDGKGHVWVVDTGGGNPVARRREVATDLSTDEGFVVALSGLRLTDRVVLNPPASMQEGIRLNVLGESTVVSSDTSSTP